MAFISAPIFGLYGKRVGAKFICSVFVFTNAVCAISFGLLTYIADTIVFVVVAHIIRFVSGIASGGAWGAAIAIFMKIFSTKVSKMTAASEMFLMMGYVLGILHERID